MGSVTSPEAVRHRLSGSVRRIYLSDPLPAYPGYNQRPVDLPSCVPPSLPVCGWVGSTRRSSPEQPALGWARTRWYRNINLLCIDYAFRPRLSSRLTLGG